MAEYNFKIIYRPGRWMGKVDALTRRQGMKEGTSAKEQNPQQLLPENKFDVPSFSSISLATLSFPLQENDMYISKLDFINVLKENKNNDKFVEKIRKAQKQDKFVKEILPYLQNVDLIRPENILEKIKGFTLESDLLCFNGLIFVPDFDKLRLEVLEYVHDSLSAGHCDEPSLNG